MGKRSKGAIPMAKKKLTLTDLNNLPPVKEVVAQVPDIAPMVQSAPRMMGQAERAAAKEYFDTLFDYVPLDRKDGEEWLDNFGELMVVILDDAKAWHLSKIQQNDEDLAEAEALKTKVAQLNKKQGRVASRSKK
jgi:hypothetical protein